jgi:hypothetical protein
MSDSTISNVPNVSPGPAMQTPLTALFSPSIRQKIYVIYALIGVILGAIQIAYSSLQLTQPPWLVAVLAIFAFVGGPLGLTAASNVPKSDSS